MGPLGTSAHVAVLIVITFTATILIGAISATDTAAADTYAGPPLPYPPRPNQNQDQLSELVIQTLSGKVRGLRQPAGPGKCADSWLGIPFASPPVGPLRFRAPLPHPVWKGVRDASTQPNSCMQTVDEFFGDFGGATQWNANTPRSEDCLYLSVTRPYPKPARPAAVMVWIYGGGFFSGTMTLQVYEPSVLASEGDVVVVAMQYRVASLGFLRLGDSPGNMGLLDQVMALQWVHDNIAQFGGDPGRVTLFGNSAGSASISMHMLSPLSRPLFRRAILQSGSATNPWAAEDAEEAQRRSRRLAEQVNCPKSPAEATLACLRQRDAEKLVNSEIFDPEIAGFSFRPVVDGVFLPENPKTAVEAGRMETLELMAGSVKDEGNYFLLYYFEQYMNLSVTPELTRANFREYIGKLFPNSSPTARLLIEFEYTDWIHPSEAVHLRDGIDKMVGDSQFACGVNDVAKANARDGGATYVWHLQQRAPGSAWPRWTGVLHGDEIFFLFGRALRGDGNYSEEEVHLTRRMIQYWTNFAKTGNPNQSEEDQYQQRTRSTKDGWPAYNTETQQYQILAGTPPATGRGLRAKQCALWSTVLPQLDDLPRPSTVECEEK